MTDIPWDHVAALAQELDGAKVNRPKLSALYCSNAYPLHPGEVDDPDFEIPTILAQGVALTPESPEA